jgi:hypothetical protein
MALRSKSAGASNVQMHSRPSFSNVGKIKTLRGQSSDSATILEQHAHIAVRIARNAQTSFLRVPSACAGQQGTVAHIQLTSKASPQSHILSTSRWPRGESSLVMRGFSGTRSPWNRLSTSLLETLALLVGPLVALCVQFVDAAFITDAPETLALLVGPLVALCVQFVDAAFITDAPVFAGAAEWSREDADSEQHRGSRCRQQDESSEGAEFCVGETSLDVLTEVACSPDALDHRVTLEQLDGIARSISHTHLQEWKEGEDFHLGQICNGQAVVVLSQPEGICWASPRFLVVQEGNEREWEVLMRIPAQPTAWVARTVREAHLRLPTVIGALLMGMTEGVSKEGERGGFQTLLGSGRVGVTPTLLGPPEGLLSITPEHSTGVGAGVDARGAAGSDDGVGGAAGSDGGVGARGTAGSDDGDGVDARGAAGSDGGVGGTPTSLGSDKGGRRGSGNGKRGKGRKRPSRGESESRIPRSGQGETNEDGGSRTRTSQRLRTGVLSGHPTTTLCLHAKGGAVSRERR